MEKEIECYEIINKKHSFSIKNSNIISNKENLNYSIPSDFFYVEKPNNDTCQSNEKFEFKFYNSITYTPFNNQDQIPFINFFNEHIPKCKNCKGFINCYCLFDLENNGKYWICNLCEVKNNTPDYYYCPINPETNLRFDIETRNELRNSSYNFTSNSL